MLINYCDLCGTPLKENEYFMLYTSTPKTLDFNEINEYHDYMKKIEKEVKEICPNCKHIFDRIFDLRLQKLSELTDEIMNTYNLPSKKNPKERKNEKEK